jgi:hypothetical protein
MKARLQSFYSQAIFPCINSAKGKHAEDIDIAD